MKTPDMNDRGVEDSSTGRRVNSFGVELFGSRLRMDLLTALLAPTVPTRQRGEAFLRRLAEFLRAQVDPLLIEPEAMIPDDVLHGLAGIGALGCACRRSTAAYG